MIKGYKAFYKGLVNQFGEKYELGKVYETSKIIYEKQGFYFCPYLEDTLRYYDGLNQDIDIALVVGSGEIQRYYDEYNETETIAATKLEILKVLTREEILEYAKSLNELEILKVIQGYRLTEEEIEYLKQKFKGRIDNYIEYYQHHDKDAFERKSK